MEETKVILSVGKIDTKFPITQAQGILDYQKQNGLNGWKLNDSNFEIVDGIIKAANTATVKDSKKRGGGTEG